MSKLVAALALSVPLSACVTSDSADLSTGAHEVRVVPRGTTCEVLGLGDRELTIVAPVSGIYAIDPVSSVRLGFDDSGTEFYFSSSIRLDGVLVHHGDESGVWDFGAEANGWPSLHGPVDPVTREALVPDAVTLCFDYDLFVNPNAYARRTARRTWDITKTGSVAEIALSQGQASEVSYRVTVAGTGTIESGWTVDGPVFVHNPTPLAATVHDIAVDVGGVTATVSCAVALPFVVAAGTTLECAYRAALPDGADRLVVAHIEAEGLPAPDGSELMSFSSHTTKTDVVDGCVDVTDSRVGGLGTVCADEGSRTFEYTVPIGPYPTCGPVEIDNTAVYVGRDSGATGSSTWTVAVDVPCSDGCTLTPGYWKTHSEQGPAPYDSTWARLPAGAATPFFISGQSYLQTLLTAPRGNVYYILAHAYAAAHLNLLAGAGFTTAQSSFDAATELLRTTSPAQAAALGATQRSRWTLLASTLDAYNNGLLGIPHCD
jgi:hypothetical protein